MPKQSSLGKIGDFEILAEIGNGGMGVVYKARDTKLQRLVALKFLPASLRDQGTQAVERFLREARTAAQLLHTNVVAIYSIAEHRDLQFIVMEYVEGTSLDKLLGKFKKLTWKEATKLIKQAAQGLAAAHAKGIIHRDIKPSNIMVTNDGAVKVADFGLARRTEESLNISHTGQTMGTPLFMSPEQCKGKEVDHRSDIYSLGATYYYLLTSRYPYEGSSVWEVMRKHVQEPLTPPSEYEPELAESVCTIVARMMAKRPEERYQSAEEVISDLERAQAGTPLGESKSVAEDVTPPTGQQPYEAWTETQPEATEGEEIPSWQIELNERKARERRNFIVLNVICGIAAVAMIIGGLLIFGGRGKARKKKTHPKHTVASKATSKRKKTGKAKAASERGQEEKLYREAASFEKETPKDYDGILGRYEAAANMPGAFNGSEWVIKAKEKITEYEEKKNESDYNRIKAEAETLIDQGKFGAAIEKYEAFSTDHILTQWSDKAKADIEAANKAAEARFKEAEAEARGHIAKNQFAEAKAIYERIAASYGIEDIADRAKKGIEDLGTLEEEEAKRQAARKQLEAEARYREAIKPVEELAASWSFAGALEKAREVEPKLDANFKLKFAERLAVIRGLGALKKQIIKRLGEHKSPIGVARPADGILYAGFIEATEEHLKYRLKQETKELKWGELSSEAPYSLASQCINPTNADHHLQLGLLCLEHVMIEKASKAFERAEKLGADVESYRRKLAERKGVKEEADAAALFKTAQDLIERKEYRKALDTIQKLKKDYADTQLVSVKERDSIKSMETRCQGEVSEIEARKLYQKALVAYRFKRYREAKKIFRKLGMEYDETKVVKEAEKALPPLSEMMKKSEELGVIVVKQKGKADFHRIQDAVNAAESGEVIEIRDSAMYNENVTIVKDPEFTITLRVAEGEEPWLRGLAAGGRAGDLEGIEINGLNFFTQPARTAIHSTFLPEITLRNSIVIGKLDITMETNNTRISLLNNYVGGPSITLGGNNAHICEARDNYFAAKSFGSSYGKRVLRNNVFTSALFVMTCDSAGCDVSGNTIVSRDAGGFSLVVAHPEKCFLKDNTIASLRNEKTMIRIDMQPWPVQLVTHCNVFPSPAFFLAGPHVPIKSGRLGEGCISKDPLFVDPKKGDFRLKEDSPCRGAASDGGDLGVRWTDEQWERFLKIHKMVAKMESRWNNR